MKNWTIAKRITLGFSALILVAIFLGVVGLTRFFQIKEETRFMATDPLPGTLAIQSISSALKEHLGLVQYHLIAPDKPEVEASIRTNSARIDQLVVEYEATITAVQDRQMFDAFKALRATFVAESHVLLSLSSGGKTPEAVSSAAARVRPSFQKVAESLDRLVNFNVENLKQSFSRVEAGVLSGSRAILIGVSLALLVGLGLATLIIRSINSVLQAVTGALHEGATQTAAAANQVSASGQSLSEGASNQAASIEETNASMEEMSGMTRRTADNAAKMNDLAKAASTAAERGRGDMHALSAAMDAIKGSSDDIAKIIKTIDEIAFQTNILALNAAVEAARAGEAGQSFAVVADEVRNLAQRSAAAAKEISAKIEGAIGKTSQGVAISAKVATALDDIVAKARQVDGLAAEVAGASHEQTQGFEQINLAVGQMEKITQASAASAEESAAAAEELSAQAETMKEVVHELRGLVDGTRRREARPAAGDRSANFTTGAARPASLQRVRLAALVSG